MLRGQSAKFEERGIVPGAGIIQILLMLALQALGQGQSRPVQLPVLSNPHGPINIPCENCHTSTSWKPIRGIPEFDHDKTRYPLRGMHGKVQCVQCHTKLVFANVGSKCADCHADIHRRQLGANCEQCHTVSGWNVSVQAIQNHFNRFPLVGAHAALECDSCHKSAATGQFQGLSTQCYSCHAKEFQQTTNPNHAKAGPQFALTNCSTCHGANTWLDAKFDHTQTGFALTGAHSQVPCVACHIGGQFAGAPTTCVGCHLKNFQGTTNPNHIQAAFPQTCLTCHNTTAWQPATFDHNTFTKFPLTGAHVAVVCSACHINGNFLGTQTTCVGCHLKNFQNTTNPNHAKAGFPQMCETCHTTTAWQPANFNHNTATKFPLTGAHATVACTLCHINGVFAGSPTTCVGCHIKNFQGTTNPNHAKAGIPQTCEICHTTAAWQPAAFDHSKTVFPLTGAHATVACSACHINSVFPNTPTTCVACHLATYQATTNPNHAKSGFPTDCKLCHTTTSWAGAVFNHSITGFPLTGFHAQVACASCHVNNNYSITTATCVSCHLANFQATKTPNHVQAGFPQTCESCHTTTSWLGAVFNHASTGFPLTGFHTQVACASCHVNNNYSITTATCVSCHLANFQATKTPNHVQSGFPQTCESCHTTTSWLGAVFNHSTTGFPLTGFHTQVACASCHVNNNYSITTATCVSCHLANFQATKTPNHMQAGFPQTCESCHTTTSWLGAVFNHASTGFPLTGFHTQVACASCHINNNYSITTATCVSCHLANYQGTTAPNHVQAAFPTDCTLCHSTTSWLGAVFNHATTGFPLTGFHATVACASCHVNNNYSLTVTTCVSCHLATYQATTTPNHVQAGFPQTCETCHTTTTWLGAVFNHDATAFPLTGFHKTSVPCASCHVNNNFKTLPVDCYGCHKAVYLATTNPNHIAANFPTTCATCHTTTTWLGATFTHNLFPVNHGGANGVCATCHTNPANYAVFQCTICHTKAQTDPKHSGNNNYVWNSVNCYQCHPHH